MEFAPKYRQHTPFRRLWRTLRVDDMSDFRMPAQDGELWIAGWLKYFLYYGDGEVGNGVVENSVVGSAQLRLLV